MDIRGIRWRYYAFSLTATQGLIAPVWVLLLLERGMSFSDIGFLGAWYWGILVIAEVPTGYIGDRLGRRSGLFIGAIFTVVGVTGLGTAHSIVTFAVVLTAWAIGVTFRSGTVDAWLYDALSQTDDSGSFPLIRGRGHAVKLTATALTAIIGSILYTRAIGMPFYLLGALSVLNAVIVLSFPGSASPESTHRFDEPSRLDETWKELTRVYQHRSLRYFVGVSIVLFGLVEVARTFIQPIVVGERVALPVVFVGVLYAGFSLVTATASAVTGEIEAAFGLRAWFLFAVTTLVASFVLLPVVPAVAVVSFVGMEAVWQVSQTLQVSVLNDFTRRARRATVLSAVSMAGGASAIVFRVIGGVFADRLGLLVMLSVIGASTGVLGMLLLRRIVWADIERVRSEPTATERIDR